MKDKLIFDTTDANTIADSDSVGAYIRSSDGSLIASVEINSVKRLAVDSTLKDGAGNALTSTGGALDVNLASPLSIDVDLDHTTGDSVIIGDGVDIMLVNVDGSINAVVTATDLDIRALDSATDSVSAVQSGSWTVTVGNPFNGVVTATDLDIRDLAHTQDSVRVGDGTNLIGSTGVNTVHGLNTYILNEEIAVNLQDGVGTPLTSTAGALDVNVTNTIAVDDVALANGSVVSAAKATAGDVVTSPLANRKYLYIYNNGNQKMFLGANGVTSGTGFPLSPGSYLELRAGAAVDIEFAAGGNIDVRSLELA